MRKWECGIGKWECGIGKWECGSWKSESRRIRNQVECGFEIIKIDRIPSFDIRHSSFVYGDSRAAIWGSIRQVTRGESVYRNMKTKDTWPK